MLLVERLNSLAQGFIQNKTATYRHLILKNKNGEQTFLFAPYRVSPMTKQYENTAWNLYEHGTEGKFWAHAVTGVGNDFVVMFKSEITSNRWVLYHYPDTDTSSHIGRLNGQAVLNTKRKNGYLLIGETIFGDLTTLY